ncbi:MULTISPECIES: ExbD/TolR family protein [unclassified Pseudoalteromonas]|uniref:ExbD/TolR family protein n=1 Tax=unclassified Pseudoalteromonas TaxID=194690 RepID=UPI00160282BE|nr:MULTISPECIES: biopolymer transporter ExbD [unclassified Pseudoalteromonas]MBB1335602.1 biopolymer transporter ExbD [Pseudoalteromonas sp. SR41-6]MBB1461152.1 biopolymer transporter ExbD [Pseudoalteromonas sp. SG41-8]
MHFPERRPDQTEERILPLINLVFLLLIFFMIAGSLSATEPFDITPPTSSSETAKDAETIVVLMNKKGHFALDNQPLSEPDLLAKITDIIKRSPNTVITIKADADLFGNHLVSFTHGLYSIGVKKLQLLTEQAQQ